MVEGKKRGEVERRFVLRFFSFFVTKKKKKKSEREGTVEKIATFFFVCLLFLAITFFHHENKKSKFSFTKRRNSTKFSRDDGREKRKTNKDPLDVLFFFLLFCSFFPIFFTYSSFFLSRHSHVASGTPQGRRRPSSPSASGIEGKRTISSSSDAAVSGTPRERRRREVARPLRGLGRHHHRRRRRKRRRRRPRSSSTSSSSTCASSKARRRDDVQ